MNDAKEKVNNIACRKGLTIEELISNKKDCHLVPAFISNTTAKTVNGSPPIRPVIAGPRIGLYPLFIRRIGSPAPAFTAE
jgi:hypothetical protein